LGGSPWQRSIDHVFNPVLTPGLASVGCCFVVGLAFSCEGDV